MADDYTPSEPTVRHSYVVIEARSDLPEARAEFDRFIAKVRRDAAREALDGLRGRELAMIPADADEDHPTRVEKQALAWRIEMLIRSDYPKETP